MDRGGLALAAELDQAGGQRRRATVLGVRAGPDQQPPAGRRRERHRDLELRVVVAAGALIGLGPAVVEDVFALRMRFQIAGHDAEDGAVGGLGDQVLRLPAGPRGGRAGCFERMTENREK